MSIPKLNMEKIKQYYNNNNNYNIKNINNFNVNNNNIKNNFEKFKDIFEEENSIYNNKNKNHFYKNFKSNSKNNNIDDDDVYSDLSDLKLNFDNIIINKRKIN